MSRSALQPWLQTKEELTGYGLIPGMQTKSRLLRDHGHGKQGRTNKQAKKQATTKNTQMNEQKKHAKPKPNQAQFNSTQLNQLTSQPT